MARRTIEPDRPNEAARPRRLEQALEGLPLTPPQPCNYLPDRLTRLRGVDAEELPRDLFASFLEIGWRRSGHVFYQPRCPSCSACIPLRVPVARFAPSRGQRRTLARNLDLHAALVPAQLSGERANLYRRYVTTCHAGPMTGDRDELSAFLGASPIDTVELEVRDPAARLLAVMTIDRTSAGWSCVYCYYEPSERSRSLGTYAILRAIELCARHCVLTETVPTQTVLTEGVLAEGAVTAQSAYLYLGYWVRGSKTMAYKSAFRPHEVRTPSGEWVPG